MYGGVLNVIFSHPHDHFICLNVRTLAPLDYNHMRSCYNLNLFVRCIFACKKASVTVGRVASKLTPIKLTLGESGHAPLHRIGRPHVHTSTAPSLCNWLDYWCSFLTWTDITESTESHDLTQIFVSGSHDQKYHIIKTTLKQKRWNLISIRN